MQGYTPVFGSVYAGTLCGKWPTAAVWVSLLPLCDKRGQIDMSHAAICALTGWPLDLLSQGICELMKPDPASRSAEAEGRRLVLLDPDNRDWGWQVVNHGLYREKARKSSFDSARAEDGRNADRMAARRKDPTRPAKTRAHPPSDSNANANADSNRGSSPLESSPSTYVSSSSPGSQGEDGLQSRSGEGRKSALTRSVRELAQSKRLPR